MTYQQLSMQFTDSDLRARLKGLELLAPLTPITWKDLQYYGKPGEIAKFVAIKKKLEGNLTGLDKVINDRETDEKTVTLAKSMRLMMRQQYRQCLETINQLQINKSFLEE